jgi:hypothetical protein
VQEGSLGSLLDAALETSPPWLEQAFAPCQASQALWWDLGETGPLRPQPPGLSVQVHDEVYGSTQGLSTLADGRL